MCVYRNFVTRLELGYCMFVIVCSTCTNLHSKWLSILFFHRSIDSIWEFYVEGRVP